MIAAATVHVYPQTPKLGAAALFESTTSIKGRRRIGFVPCPVGGMLWKRPRAFPPLV